MKISQNKIKTEFIPAIEIRGKKKAEGILWNNFVTTFTSNATRPSKTPYEARPPAHINANPSWCIASHVSRCGWYTFKFKWQRSENYEKFNDDIFFTNFQSLQPQKCLQIWSFQLEQAKTISFFFFYFKRKAERKIYSF